MVSKKYLGDYRLENIPDGRGGVKAAPVYCGKLFRFSLPPERVRQLRLSRVLLAAACTLALLVPLLLTAEVPGRWYVLLPLALVFTTSPRTCHLATSIMPESTVRR